MALFWGEKSKKVLANGTLNDNKEISCSVLFYWFFINNLRKTFSILAPLPLCMSK